MVCCTVANYVVTKWHQKLILKYFAGKQKYTCMIQFKSTAYQVIMYYCWWIQILHQLILIDTGHVLLEVCIGISRFCIPCFVGSDNSSARLPEHNIAKGLEAPSRENVRVMANAACVVTQWQNLSNEQPCFANMLRQVALSEWLLNLTCASKAWGLPTTREATSLPLPCNL